MSVHYKFKSALNFDTITFDGLHISVGDLKKEIIHHKRLGKVIDFDLQITNAQTKDEYADESTLIPKNTSLIIARIPLTHQPKKSWEPIPEKTFTHKPVKPDNETLDISQMNGTEEDKINLMMAQSTMDYDPKGYQKLRGQGQTGEVPANYRCFKCQKPGHWIKNCPLNSCKDLPEIKRSTGIPRSFIQEKEEKNEDHPETFVAFEPKQDIPDDLICSICKDIFTDAVMIPCCGSSFCDECVRTALIASDDSECPDCKEKGSSPASLIPNRFLRNSVNSFKNETGYTRSKQDEMTRLKQTKKITKIEPEPTPATENDSIEEVSKQPSTETVIEEVIKEEIPQPEFEEVNPPEDENEKKDFTPSSHEDSDFEDNITVTVPPPYMQNHGSMLRDRNYNGNNSRKHRVAPPEESPRHRIQPISYSGKSPTYHHDQEEESTLQEHQFEMENDVKNNRMPQPYYPPRDVGMHCPRQAAPIYGGPPMAPMQHHGNQQQMMKPYNMDMCGSRPSGYSQYYRNQFPPQRSGFMNMPPQHSSHAVPSNLADVYKNVAQKVGTGIIEDPLATFNLLMKERENRKYQKRSQHRHRSRSLEKNFRAKGAPTRAWAKSPQDRGRSPGYRIKGRSNDRRRRNSSSGSGKSSRSRSPTMVRKRSPIPRRRSWSRSPSFRNRSRSRSPSRGNFNKGSGHYFNHSPKRSISPRYRGEEIPFSNKDVFKYMDSPHNRIRSDRSRGRSPGNHHHRSRHADSRNSFDEQPFRMEQVSRNRPPRDFKSSSGRDIRYDQEMRYPMDDVPPGTEPIPPGFENMEEDIGGLANKVTGNPSFEDNEIQREREYAVRGYTPDISSRPTQGTSSRHDEGRRRSSRSPSPRRGAKSSSKHSRGQSSDHKHSEGKMQIKSKNNSQDKRTEREDDYNHDHHENEKFSCAVTKIEHRESGRDHSPNNNEHKSKKVKDKKKKKKEEKEKKKSKKDRKDKEKRDRSKIRKDINVENQDALKISKSTDELPHKQNIAPESSIDASKESSGRKSPGLNNTNDILNIYDDICKDDVTEPQNQSDEGVPYIQSTNAELRTSSPRDMKHLDSVLDIYDFEQPLDDFNVSHPNLNASSNDECLMEASKWDLDDENIGQVMANEACNFHDADGNHLDTVDKKTGKVTTEIIRRAENAIFTKAINAIKPIEIKKISVDRQKIYSNEKSSKSQSPSFPPNSTENKELKSVQITVPANNSIDKRSVEIKSEASNDNRSRSIKNRLGRKVSETRVSLSRSLSRDRENAKSRSHASNAKKRSCSRPRDRERERYDRDNTHRSNTRQTREHRERDDIRSAPSRDSKSKHNSRSSTRKEIKSSVPSHSTSSSARRPSEYSDRNPRKRVASPTPAESKVDKRTRSDRNDEKPSKSGDRNIRRACSSPSKENKKHLQSVKDNVSAEVAKCSSDSSSSSSDSDSSTNSDDNRNKRKRKHKSKKKRAKSVSVSRSSPRSKKTKYKKKSKSSKRGKSKKDD